MNFPTIATVDDLCLSYLDNFALFDQLKKDIPSFKMVAFTIANFKNKEPLVESAAFKKWFNQHKDWVEIGVHSYDHLPPPDGDREDEKHWISKALTGLRPFLPAKYSYRSPGWQTSNRTVPILKELGFAYIFYEGSIRNLQEDLTLEMNVVNSHLYDILSIRRIEEIVKNEIL